jgi:hypothetical protein
VFDSNELLKTPGATLSMEKYLREKPKFFFRPKKKKQKPSALFSLDDHGVKQTK